jgi:DNA-binding NtrC family response regulator
VESQILICGNDEMLLRTRALVLESAGFRVRSKLGLVHLKQMVPQQCDVCLIVLCHSLGETEREEALRHLSRAMPASKILVLTIGERLPPAPATISLNTFDGPEALIATVNGLAA